jgi:hypothetical protein
MPIANWLVFQAELQIPLSGRLPGFTPMKALVIISWPFYFLVISQL